MDIKEIVLRLLVEEFPGMRQENQAFMADFAEALIESYKAELLKEVGEPVGYRWRVKGYGDNKSQFCPDWGFTSSRQTVDEDDEPLFTSDQVAAAILKVTKPLEEEIDRLESESEEYAQLQSRCFDGGGSHASVFDEVSELRAQLAAAQEQIQRMTRERLRTADAIESMHASHKDQLAKAEQRVAEACALQVATETKFHWLDAARVAKEIRSGEWRKFVKEV